MLFRILSGRLRSAVAALAVVAAVGLVLAVAPAATAQSAPTLTVTPASIERPAAGSANATLNFTVGNCDGCTVELDPGWLLPAADQAVKGKNGDFGAANYWSANVVYGNKRGKGPVPDALGIKVRAADNTRKFIRFTLNDSNGFVVAEAKVWLTPRQAPQPQQPQQNEPQQPNQEPEYELNTVIGNEGEEIECWVGMTNGTVLQGGYHVEEKHRRGWFDREYRLWHWETTYTTRPLRPGEYFRLEFGTYRDGGEGSSAFDFRWKLVSVTDARTGEEMDNFGLPTDTNEPGGGFNAPDKSFTINYRIEAHPTAFASSTCSATFAVR